MTVGTDFMPTLSSGAHSAGSGQACVMEYVSVLAGEEFSDHPSCTHPMIASVARSLNDALYDNKRHLLVPLIPRLLVANTTNTAEYERATAALREYAKSVTIVENGKQLPDCVMKMLSQFGYSKTFEGITVAVLSTSVTPENQIKYLTGLLDTFDKAVGREAPVVENYENRLTRAIAKVEGRTPPKPSFREKFSNWLTPVEEAQPVEPVVPVVKMVDGSQWKIESITGDPGVNYTAVFKELASK